MKSRAVRSFLAFAVITSASAVALAEPAKPQTQPAGAASAVDVTVKYAGKGTVDADHRIWVWLFTSPDIGPGAVPIAEESIQKNGGTATFSNVAAKEVFIAIAYDEKGGFTGSAPPPTGSPIALYGAKGPEDKPMAVIPGPKASVKVTFNDAQRMQ